MKVYWSSVEYNYLDDIKMKGGFVYVFVKSRDAISAYEKIQKELVKEHLSPISWDYISPYDINTEWDSEEEMLHYKKLYEMAKKVINVFLIHFMRIRRLR